MMTGRPASRIHIVAAMALGITIALGLTELMARTWFENDPSLYRRRSNVYNHEFRPLGRGRDIRAEWDVRFVIDRHGMRIAPTEDPHRSPGGGILVLGDSFAEGAGVEFEDSLSYLVGQRLGRPVFNEAVTSYSPLIHYVWLKRNLRLVNPEVVVLLLDIGDVQDDGLYEPLATFDSSGEPVAVGATAVCWDRGSCAAMDQRRWLPQWARDWIRDSCRSCVAARSALGRLRSAPSAHVLPEDRCHYRYDRFAPTRGSCGTTGWDRTFGWVSRIHNHLREAGIPLLVVTYPYPHQVSPHEWDVGRSRYLFEPGRVYSDDRFDRAVAAFMVQQGIPHMSLYATFREATVAGPSNRLFFRDDPHFNAAGHRLAASAIARRLEQEL